jgi:hypothetical protein
VASSQANTRGGSITVVSSLWGPDADLYTPPGDFTFSVSAPTFLVSGNLADYSSPLEFDVGFPYSYTITLSRAALTDITVTFATDVLTFTPSSLVIPAGHFSATASFSASVYGAGSAEWWLSGDDASSFAPQDGQVTNVYFTVYPRWIDLTAASTHYISVGGETPVFDFGLWYWTTAGQAPTVNGLNVSFIVSPPGAATVNPVETYVAYPSTSFAVRVTANVLGTIVLTPVFSGLDSGLYDPTQVGENQITVVGQRRSFSIMPAVSTDNGNGRPTDENNQFYDRYQNGVDDSAYGTIYHLQTYVGVASAPISVTAVSVPTDVSLVVEGHGLIISPSVLRFTGTYESLSFTITPVEAIGNTYVHFTTVGPDAALFDLPDPILVKTHHVFVIPEFPALTVGVPVTLPISISSNFSTPVVVTPSVSNVVFRPETILLSPAKPLAYFEIVGITTQSNRDNSESVLASVFSFHWRYVHNTNAQSHLWYPPSPIGINVLPATFEVNFPHLQIGLTSTLTISVTAPPRSDVVLTLFGNNLNFNPTYALFTAKTTTVQISVTPVHSDYQASDDIPFDVYYYISGTNQADYVQPQDTYLAVSRGSAAEADSLVLSGAATTVASFAVVLLVSVVALL